MQTSWWWVRHGPTHQKVFTGWRDVPADLSDLNRISRLRNFLPKKSIMVSSDLKRATATAQAIGAETAPLIIEPNLREFNFGIWDGMPSEEIEKRDPELCREFWENPGDVMAPEGESWNMLKSRVSTAVNKINVEYKGNNIIAVAHFGVILTQLHLAIGGDAYDILANKIDNLSVTKISKEDQKWEVEMINICP
ncbi:MAG: histidine phosphatase family protein [Proteobacteria bacterium]|jgi:alpha-ribazole phosphatase|nr:histidine phosphatase family protein [Pseudomonadota bacterium]